MKTNQITFKVAKLDDTTAKAIGIAVTSDTAPAKEVGMTRDQLADLGFEGKLGQTLVLPNGKKQMTIVVGIGETHRARGVEGPFHRGGGALGQCRLRKAGKRQGRQERQEKAAVQRHGTGTFHANIRGHSLARIAVTLTAMPGGIEAGAMTSS